MSEDNKRYDLRGQVFLLWEIRADELAQAAHQVWYGGAFTLKDQNGDEHVIYELYRPAQLLMGLSLEALAKGILIQRDPSLVKDGKLNSRLKTHSIEKLFCLVGISLAPGEEELNFARRLSDAIEWVAKYPVPLNARELDSSRNRSERTLFRSDNDMERFKTLRERLRGLVDGV